jgi:hypothetical protein
MLAHDLAGALSIVKKARVSNLAFQLLESLAFTFNEKIEIHWCFCSHGVLLPCERRPAQRGGYRIQLRLFAAARRFCAAVTPREFLDSASSIDEFLFAGEKRMAGGANADFNIPPRRTRVIDGTTGADDVGLVILRMNVRLHIQKRTENLSAIEHFRK